VCLVCNVQLTRSYNSLVIVGVSDKSRLMCCRRLSGKQHQTVAPERIWKWGGAPVPSKNGGGASAGKTIFGRAPPLFCSKSTIILVVLVSAFVIVSTVWSFYWLLFFHSRCFPCPAICKSGGGGHVPPVPHGVGATCIRWVVQSGCGWPRPRIQTESRNQENKYITLHHINYKVKNA